MTKTVEKIEINDYSYNLPQERIAKYPLYERDKSKLLVFNKNGIEESVFNRLPDFIPPESQLYVNDTKVIYARLKFKKATGANIELFCLNPYNPTDYQISFSQTKSCTWICMVGNLKKWKNEILLLSFEFNSLKHSLKAEKIGVSEGHVIVRFTWDGDLSFGEVLDSIGNIPIPPYLNRESEPIDKDRYQTVYSDIKGSVAAPTAGLHITRDVISRLKKKNIVPQTITLHVGAGTFQPVKTGNALEHVMHSEVFSVSMQTLTKLAKSNAPVIATGTTSLRTLESLYWLGVKSIENRKLCSKLEQWDYKTLPDNLSPKEVFKKFVEILKQENTNTYNAETAIMIVPGYSFKVVDALITNYHQPKSTLLLLVAAFIGEQWKDVYDYAMQNNFRFLSYGDSSFLWRK